MLSHRQICDISLAVQVLGVLNTVTGSVEACAKLRMMFGLPKPIARVASTLPRDYVRRLRQRARVRRPLCEAGGSARCMAGRMVVRGQDGGLTLHRWAWG